SGLPCDTDVPPTVVILGSNHDSRQNLSDKRIPVLSELAGERILPQIRYAPSVCAIDPCAKRRPRHDGWRFFQACKGKQRRNGRLEICRYARDVATLFISDRLMG